MRKKDKLYTIKQPINLYDEGGDTENNEESTEESTLLEALTNGNGFNLKNLFTNKNIGTIAKKGLGTIGTAVGQIGGGLIGEIGRASCRERV